MKRIYSKVFAVLFILLVAGCSLGTQDTNTDQTVSRSISGSTPVQDHGNLSVSGRFIVGEHGNPVYLRGMSFFWSQWWSDFWNATNVEVMAQDWNCDIVRAAMAVENGGYLTNPELEKARVITIVDAAIANGIYVIIDWHDHDAILHQAESIAFFQEMAQLYGSSPNVIFEIFNEPDYESWPEVKAYSEAVIAAIRAEGADNIIVVGTPTWCQDVDIVSQDPITGYSNIAYSLHFYAASHQDWNLSKAQTAIDNGLPMMATEWGTCEYTGDGYVDEQYSNTWISFMETNSISWCNWSINHKDESASILIPGTSFTGPWDDSLLTQSGRFIKAAISGIAPPPPAVPPGTFNLLTPAQRARNVSVTPFFDWSDASGADSYTILVDNDYDFSSPEISVSGLTSSDFTATGNLNVKTKYNWKVIAVNEDGSTESGINQFTTIRK